MQRLAPLVVCLFVAMSAVLGFGESTGLDEIVCVRGGITRERKVVFAEAKIERLADFFRVVCAVESAVGMNLSGEVHRSQERGDAQREANNDAD